MKVKILLLLLASVFCLPTLKAQTQQGSFLAGGSISMAFEKEKSKFDGTTTDGDSHTDISFAPIGGIFFADGMVAGAGITVSSSVRESDDGSIKSTTTGFGIMPFFRYYHESGLFGHASFAVGSGKSTFESGGTETETKFGLFEWELGPGYALFLNENVAVEGLLVYNSETQSIKDVTGDPKNITTGILISIGFTVFIN